MVHVLDMQVGAGTMNPATFLRVLGPEPWRVCYVEPSVRPDDSRYGDNPNRLQQHTQFQARPLQTPSRDQTRALLQIAAWSRALLSFAVVFETFIVCHDK